MRIRYVAERRNGYGAVDEYGTDTRDDGSERLRCLRTVVCGTTYKLAEQMAGELQSAYDYGRRDVENT